MDITEKLIEFIANKVKQQRFYTINDIPPEELKEFRKISRELAKYALSKTYRS